MILGLEAVVKHFLNPIVASSLRTCRPIPSFPVGFRVETMERPQRSGRVNYANLNASGTDDQANCVRAQRGGD